MRPLPEPDAQTRFYWDALREGRLEILRCDACGTWIHYPKPSCRSCGATSLTPQAVSGRGVIHSYTVTHQPVEGFDSPFAVVLVELDEQTGLRVVSNVIDVPAEDIRIGMPVQVSFVQESDVTLPLFRGTE